MIACQKLHPRFSPPRRRTCPPAMAQARRQVAALRPRLPLSGIAPQVIHRYHRHLRRVDPIGHRILMPAQGRDPQLLKLLGIHLRMAPDPGKHLLYAQQKVRTLARSPSFALNVSGFQVGLGQRIDDYPEAHDPPPSIRDLTSSQGEPASGSSRYCSSRRCKSARWASLSREIPGVAVTLSHSSPAKRRRSAELSCSKPSALIVADIECSLRWRATPSGYHRLTTG